VKRKVPRLAGLFFLSHIPFGLRRVLPQRLSEFSQQFPQQSDVTKGATVGDRTIKKY
jgi:DNA-binding transcriptional LysR family regulator